MAHGRWPMATPAGRPARWPPGSLAARLAGRIAAGRRPPGSLAAGRALRRWAPGQGRRPMATAAEGPQTKFFIAHIAHTTHKFLNLFLVYSAHV